MPQVRTRASSNVAVYDRKEDNPKYVEDWRVCLSCGEEFLSSWYGHSICASCKSSAKFKHGTSDLTAQLPRKTGKQNGEN